MYTPRQELVDGIAMQYSDSNIVTWSVGAGIAKSLESKQLQSKPEAPAIQPAAAALQPVAQPFSYFMLGMFYLGNALGDEKASTTTTESIPTSISSSSASKKQMEKPNGLRSLISDGTSNSSDGSMSSLSISLHGGGMKIHPDKPSSSSSLDRRCLK